MALLVLAKRDGRGGSDGGLPWMLGACVHLAGKWQRAAATKRLHAAARQFHAAAACSCGHHRSNLLALKKSASRRRERGANLGGDRGGREERI